MAGWLLRYKTSNQLWAKYVTLTFFKRKCRMVQIQFSESLLLTSEAYKEFNNVQRQQQHQKQQ